MSWGTHHVRPNHEELRLKVPADPPVYGIEYSHIELVPFLIQRPVLAHRWSKGRWCIINFSERFRDENVKAKPDVANIRTLEFRTTGRVD